LSPTKKNSEPFLALFDVWVISYKPCNRND